MLLTYAERHMQDTWYLYCSVMSDYLFSENNIVFPRTQKSRGNTICSSENKFIQTEILFFFIFFWRWRGGGGFIINIFIFIFFYGGASHITGGGCGGLIFFKRSGLFFYFLFFFMVVVAPHWGRVAWVKIKK